MGTVEMMSKLQELKEIRAELEALEEQEAALVDELKAEMLSRGVSELKAGTHKAMWTKYMMHRFDTKAFRSENEELYGKYEVEVEASRFTLK